uniref:Protein CREG2 n=1 Tax=Anthurium amnicola TaxID=1678845 RepID=A0A1D1YSU8_9ARAE
MAIPRTEALSHRSSLPWSFNVAVRQSSQTRATSSIVAMRREPGGASFSSSSTHLLLRLLSPVLLLLFLWHPPLVAGARPRLLISKPDPSDAAATARWLASQNSWGVLSTISVDLKGSPFGNVVSFSDGLPGKGYGIPYFYLTALDPTARDALKDERASFTVSEFPIGSCGEIDPENPTCAKLTLTGKLKLVDGNSTEGKYARLALFAKHTEMKGWPKDHNFQIFKLDIQNIFLIDWFGGAKPLTLDQYLKPVICREGKQKWEVKREGKVRNALLGNFLNHK